MKEGTKFRQKGQDMEIAPAQPNDPHTKVRVRKAGSDNKGQLIGKQNLLEKLSDKLNTDFVLHQPDVATEQHYDRMLNKKS